MFNIDITREEVRDAFRLASQSELAAAASHVCLELIGSNEQFVGVLSAVVIVQPSVGRTVSAGSERMLATIVGSVIGLACLFLLPAGYGVAVALAVVVFSINFIAGFRPYWRGGVVAAVALALANTSGDMEVAKARAIAIGIGIAIGVIASLIVWPESSAKRALRHSNNALRASAERFGSALREEENGEDSNRARENFHRSLSMGREASDTAPDQHRDFLKQRLETIETLYNSIIVIDRVESPLSAFDDEVISREALIDSGKNALLAIAQNDDRLGEFCEKFSEAISQASDGLKSYDIKDKQTQRGASVIFGLREMETCVKNLFDLINNSGSDFSTGNFTKIQEIVPKALT